MATIAEIRRKYPQYSDLNDRQLASALRTKFYSDIPEDDFLRRVGLGGTDFIDDMQRGAGQAIAAVGSALRDVPIPQVSALGQKAEEYGNKVVQANPADMPSISEIKSVSDVLSYAGERVAEIIPQAAAPLAAAGVATLAGAAAPVAGAASFGAGALSGFGQAYGGIREQQREQGLEDKARAAAFATPSAVLDALGVGRFIPGSRQILGDIVETGLRGIAKTGARVGAEEGVTEVAQTALERGGALKPLTDEEAQAEYLNALAAGAVGGGTIGAGGAAVRTVTDRLPVAGEPQPKPTALPAEPEPVVPATPFGAAPVPAPEPTPAGPFVTIDEDEVVIEQPDGGVRIVPRAEWEATQRPATAPAAEPAPVSEPVARPVAEPAPPRPAPAPENVRTVVTPGGMKINTAFEVVEAGDLQAATGDLQNRDRTRAATDVQVQDIFSKFDPTRLGDSLESDRGSPIIGPDNVVESGNGRVMAISKVYDESPERAQAYRDFIQSQGFDTTGFQRPVLVRRRVDELTPEARSQFVRESNMDTKLRLSTSEQAGTDAAALTADVMGLMQSPDVTQAVNREFVRGFLSKLPPQEQAAFLDKDGALSAEGSRRLRTAIKASAYGDADLINTLDESQDNNIKSIGGALEDVAPNWRRLRDAVAEGRVRPEMDVTDRLVEAAKIVRDMRNRGQKVEDFLAQQDAFNPLNPITERFIRSFYNPKTGRALGRDAITDVLDKYARRAAEQTTEDQLFATEQLTPEQVLDGIAVPEEAGLFQSVEGSLPADQAEVLEEASKVPSLSRGVAKLLRRWRAGKIDDSVLAASVAELSDYIEYMKDGRNYRVAQRGRARGADRIMEVLFREKRKGNVSDETVEFMLWALKGNPNLAEDLAISTRAAKERGAAGEYDPIRRLMTLFKESASDTTAVHEMLHHTERMMPPDVQAEIRKVWLREFNKAAEKGKSNPNVNTFFRALRALHGRTKFTVGNETFGPSEGWKVALDLINDGSVPYSYYQYVNPSEFWAVNATDIMRKRFDVKDSTLGRIRNWLGELVEKAKGLFNLSATSPLIKALDSLAKADGKFNSLTMLQEEGSRYMSVEDVSERPRITPPKETRGETWSRKIVDRFKRLQVVQNLGQLRAGIEGFYEAARKFDSRAGELMAKFNRDYFQPIEKIMKEAGLNLETVDAYLYARAAPARNARLQRKAEDTLRAKMEANGATDAEVLAAIRKAIRDGDIPTAGSGMTTQEADDIMNGFRGQDYFPALERIGEIFNRANKARMENNIQRGLVSREVGERLLREEPDYVPMQGFALDENLTEPTEDFEDVMGYGGSGFGVSVREWYDTRGRTSLGFSPLGTFISNVGTSIVRGERNRVGQKLMTFFVDNPSDSWKVFSYRNPPRDRKGNPQRPGPYDPNFMVVKRGGEIFYLRIDDPLLAKAAKNLNPQQMNSLLQISSNLTRMLSRSFTTANPDFFVPNVFRDLQSAALNLGAEAPGLLKAFGKNIKDGKAFRSVAAFEYGRDGGDPALRDLYEQFKLDGGSVSWVQRETPQEAAARIQKDLKTVNESLQDLKDARSAKQAIDAVWNPTSKGFRAMVDALESTNATFENSVRFAAYRAALDVGMSREQAAMIVREATVDFNRRGEAGALLNALYAFFNAGIQGTVRTARALSNNPFKTGKLSTTQAALLGMMTTAATLAAANAAISDEDEDGKLFWDKIPPHEKERNLIIMNPLDGKTPIKIPMPYGFGFFPYLATRTMDAARRGEDLGAVGLDLTTAALGNFSPVQFGAGNIPSSIARAATPTMAKPFVELMLNENAFGKPIYNEPFDKGQSYASVARFNTWDGFKDLSQFLNDISGGEGKLKGNMNAPAESFEYLTEFALGGVTNLAKSLYKTGTEGNILAAPALRRLVGEPGKGRNVGEYYEREERARVINQQMKDLTGAERMALREKYPVETHPRVQSALTQARSAVRKLNEERKRIQKLDINEGVKAERLEALRERVDAEFVRFNRVYNQVEQATR